MFNVHRTFSALLITFILLAVTAALALAHAHFKSSVPVDGSVVAKAPAQVTVTLAEETSLKQSYLVVLDASGKQVDNKDGHTDPNNRTNIIVGLPANLPDGVYQARWHGLTEDDNGQTWGAIQFRVGAGVAPAALKGDSASEEKAPSWANLHQPSATSTTTTSGAAPQTMPVTGAEDLLPQALVAVGGGLALALSGFALRRQRH